ncbi:transcription termination/antitermination protein NusG [Tropicimonas sediminicola]|uniref:transcription termination/antitermination protein NusG n=1 Tax=Tropicimonas sediminicola TaxID=1031541 RepID=UPI0015955863|nr:transcription termination/antitermination NusG family protein [Tropicimonas sediminicola]
MPAPQGPPWLVAQLKPNGLKAAVLNLERQGIETLMLWRTETIARGRKFFDRQVPLFPGYLFVRPGVGAPWRSIQSTVGVARLIFVTKDHPAEVPQDFIDALAARCDGDGCVQHDRPVKVGQEVRITRGPMHDLVACVERLDGPSRVGVLLEIMGRPVRASLLQRDLESIEVTLRTGALNGKGASF